MEKLGLKNDILTVKTGYARNYLIPKGMPSRPQTQPSRCTMRT
ncbi:MAG: bL9 family ribosomal protein [Marinilabiliales bacterium]|nr:bL9 family ribosomal protein [Marinilabiliales bacterium]